MNRLVLICIALACLSACSREDNSDSVRYVDYVDSTRISVSDVIDLGSKPSTFQALALYGNRAYQFYSSSVCRVFDLDTKELVSSIDLPEGHYGSAVFSTEYGYPDSDVPLLYIGGRMTGKEKEGYVVLDLHKKEIVRIIEFDEQTAAQVLCAFDFQHGIGYSFGYMNDDPDHEAAPYEVTPFDIATGKCDISNRFYIENEGHLQDACFKDGNIYIITGWNRQWNGKDVPVKILGVDPVAKCTTMVMNLGFVNNEGEGIALYKDGFLISVRKLYKMLYVTYQ